MQTVISRDGTRIAYSLRGSGPGIVFSPGVFNDHTRCADLASALASDHTVIVYDRRGRGESGDTAPYAIEREVEDLAALVALCDGPATVFGYSSGAMLALLAASMNVQMGGLVMFEPPSWTIKTLRVLPYPLYSWIIQKATGDRQRLAKSDS